MAIKGERKKVAAMVRMVCNKCGKGYWEQQTAYWRILKGLTEPICDKCLGLK